MVAQAIAWLYAPGAAPAVESDPLDPAPRVDRAAPATGRPVSAALAHERGWRPRHRLAG